MTSWRKILTEAFKKNGESWDDVVYMEGKGSLGNTFKKGDSWDEGFPFSKLWTKSRIYFPDHSYGDDYEPANEWAWSVLRNPPNE